MQYEIGFIGLGKLGLPCAEVLSKHGHNVDGYDIAGFESDWVSQASSIESLVRDKDIVFIAVPTPHDPEYGGEMPTSHLPAKDFDYSIVDQVLHEADRYMSADQKLVLISTVLPGTCRTNFVPVNTRLIYNPYLIAMGSVAWDMLNPEMVILGTEHEDDTAFMEQFYIDLVGPHVRFASGTYEEAESIKVFYNTFISMKLAFVNMIMDVSENIGHCNVDVVTNALAKSDKRIMGRQYMTAGMGDGGACHPRDNIALSALSDRLDLGYDMSGDIMRVREDQARRLAEVMCAHSVMCRLPIVILGVAYKPNVPYTDGSYSLLVDYYCRENGMDAILVDPLADRCQRTIDEPAVVLLGHDASITYRYAEDVTNVTTPIEIPKGSIIIDPWRTFNQEGYEVVLPYGDTRESYYASN